MRTPFLPRAASGTLALAVAGLLAPAAAPIAAAAPLPQTAPVASVRTSVAAATDPGALVALPAGQECPTGTAKLSTQYSNGFEDQTIPEPSYSQGWSVISGQARTGAYSARSTITAADPKTQPTDPPYWRMGLPLLTVPGGHTVLRYDIKGNYPADAAFVSVNSASGSADPSPSWGTVTIDATGAIQPSDNHVADIRFANYPATPATDSQIDLDNISVYTCTGQSKVRGDYDGDGIADLITVDANGILQVWPGTGDFHVKAPIQAGTGWGSVTWIGSSGDLNGDGRADILARFSNGDLIVYYGDGGGGFSVGTQKVGIGWNGINAVVPMGDINGDGLPDFLARDTAGNMRRYWLASQGGVLTGGTIVGVGFNDFTSLFSMGDFNHDGRFDLTGILSNGDMRVYTTLATGALWGSGQKIGNGWFFRQVTTSGDYNKDGNPDVLALDNSGNILSYPVLGDGKWGAITKTGVGFNAFKLIG